ncbi:MAG: DUF86 domain-containing protein [Candidatus Altiarchaeota archaeon]|nr:DUF86 domain-containing protein [Candidatus Altiarchaeota archaeon]
MKHDGVYLKHILDELDFLVRETEGLEFDDLLADEVLKRAVSRSLEIVGEAAKNISPPMRDSHGEIDWKKIAGLRDKMIHHYFGVNWDIVWDVLKNQAPKLREQVRDVLDTL